MPYRPYTTSSFQALKSLFDESRRDFQKLNLIQEELSYRKKNRNIGTFMEELETAIAAIDPNQNQKVEEIRTPFTVELHNPESKIDTVVPTNWDSEQRTVIELGENDTKIVEAGPGAGKTAVACARVAHLIELGGLEAVKILMISFTRTAVKELRDRIEAFAQNPVNVAGLQIFTLDSFTWQVLRGLGDDESADLMCSYETNIKALIKQLKDGDAQLLDYFEEFEHVVLDEGQDLVGDRADLVIEIIRNLEDDCGVTVFADSAQAIYGFTVDSEQHGTHQSLTVVERIMQNELEGFDRIKLVNVHRTDDPKLKKLFKVGRDNLLDKKESDIKGWKAMKQLITDCSHGEVGAVMDQELAGKSDHLVLFRTRAEVLMASSFLWGAEVIHKLRMSGTAQRVHPWIGRLLGEFEDDYLAQDQFDTLWKEQIGESNGAGKPDRDEAWQLLLENVGDKNDRVRVVRLREILSRDRPPIDFIIDESELAGPVLGTIHASKGREANQVHLMLPPDKFMEEDESSRYALSPREIAEEERVLFVGATRAKQKLMVGKGSKMYASRLESGRTFKKPRNGNGKRMMEIGLSGDIDLVSVADGRLGDNSQELQDWLWKNATSKVEIEAKFDHDLKSNVLYAKDDGRPIGLLSKRFSRDLWDMAEIVANNEGSGRLKPGLKINYIRMVGVTTVVIPESQRDNLAAPWRHSGFVLAPVITGFPIVYFNR